MAVGDLFGGISLGGGSMTTTIAVIIFGAVALGVVIGVIFYFTKVKKKWNLKVEFKIPRDIIKSPTGKVKGSITKEWGKGFYDAKIGVVFLKRHKKRMVPMKPFDVKRFLSQSSVLTVIQVGIEDYRPVLDESYLEVEDDQPLLDEKGQIMRDAQGEMIFQQAALVRAKIDTSESKSWARQFERDTKLTYSIKSWLAEHGSYVAMGFVILLVLIGQAIVISKLQ